jgi:hypothetical protein
LNLVQQYRELQAKPADASLIQLAETLGDGLGLSTDRCDFAP